MDEIRDLLVQILHGIKETNAHLQRLGAVGTPSINHDFSGNSRNFAEPANLKFGRAGVDGDAIRREIEDKIARARQSTQDRVNSIKSK